MTIWIILWLIISTVMLAFLGWTLFVLMKQKSAWKVFAKKYKLRYKSNATMQAPEMNGVIDDYTVGFFASEHASYDVRGSRSLTAVEVSMDSTLPVEGVIASGGMVPIAQMLDLKAELRPDHEKWDKSYVALTDNKHVLSEYLDDKRLNALVELMGRKSTWLMFVFKKEMTLLRVDIADPLMTTENLEETKNAVIETAKLLELDKGEGKRLKTAETRAASRDIELEIEDKDEDAATGLTLEDDHEDKVTAEAETETETEADSGEFSEEKAKD